MRRLGSGEESSSSQATHMRPRKLGTLATFEPSLPEMLPEAAKNMFCASFSPSRPWRKGKMALSGAWEVRYLR